MSNTTTKWHVAGEVAPFRMDWRRLLAAEDGDTIASGVWSVETDGSLQIVSETHAAGVSTVRVSGGDAAEEAVLTCTITTAAASVFARVLRIRVRGEA
jgi:hypothetical protein